jgi:hypothetical protein
MIFCHMIFMGHTDDIMLYQFSRAGCSVYWYNLVTKQLELVVVKSPYLPDASPHADGRANWHADALPEVAALGKLAGVPGVVGFRQMVTGPDGALHIILE